MLLPPLLEADRSIARGRRGPREQSGAKPWSFTRSRYASLCSFARGASGNRQRSAERWLLDTPLVSWAASRTRRY